MRIALIVVGVVSLIIAGAGLFVATADPNDYKGWIEATASRALDKTVELRGPIELERSLTPRVVVADLVVLEPGDSEPVLQVGRAEASLALSALLRGQIHLPRVAIARVRARLPMAPAEEDGRDTDDVGPPPRLPRIDVVEITDALIGYVDDDRTVDLYVESAVVEQEDQQTALDVTGQLGGLPLAITGTTGTVAALLAGEADLPTAFHASLDEARLAATGTISLGPGGRDRDFDIDLVLDVPAPAKLAGLAGAALPPMPATRASAKLRHAGGDVLIEDLAVAIGESELSGDLTLGFGGPRPALSGALHASLVDLAELVPPDDGGAPASDTSAQDGRVIPPVALPLPSMVPIDLDLAIAVERVDFPPGEIENIEAKVGASRATLTFDVTRAELLRGLVGLAYRADVSASPPTIAVRVDVDDIDLDDLLDRSTLRGKLDLILQLDGQGVDLRTFLGGADGRVDVTTGSLFVPGDLANLAGRNVLVAILPTFEEEPGLEIHCSLVRFAVAGGKATTTDLVVDAEHLTVGGGGGVDLASEEIDFLILPEGKGVRLASLTAPVHVGGTLAAPRVLPDAPEFLFSAAEHLAFGAIDVGTLVIPVLKPGTSGKDACVAAAEGPGKDPETVFDTAGGVVSGAAEGIGAAAGAVGGAVKGAGESAIEALGGLFGAGSADQQ